MVEKKFKVHHTPKSKSEKNILEPIMDALIMAREEEMVGVFVGMIRRDDDKKDKFIINSFIGIDCDTGDGKDLADEIKYVAHDWHYEREFEGDPEDV